MKFSVVFPNVMYREGPEGVSRFIRGVESIGFDELDMFDHVLMGYPTETRKAPFYPSQMPLMEALMTLSYAAAVTERIKLCTGIIQLAARTPANAAMQAGTIDAMASCVAECDASVEPGSVEVQCEKGKLSGTCEAECSS